MAEAKFLKLKLQIVSEIPPEGDVELTVANWSHNVLLDMGKSWGMSYAQTMDELVYQIDQQYGNALREIFERAQKYGYPKFSEIVELKIDVEEMKERGSTLTALSKAGLGYFLARREPS